MSNAAAKLAIGADMPLALASERIVILGKSGAGKTNAGAVLIEEFVSHDVPTVVLDILGNMHGLRAAGAGSGLSIAILGGMHGDVELRSDRGALVADLIADGLSAVIDLSRFERGEAQRFVTDFLTQLVPAVQRSRRNVHVVLEEAETYAPERVSGREHNAVRAATTIFARTARNVGIGWTFSTQRPQLLAKDVIDSSTAFMAMRMTGDLAQEAIGAEARSRVGKTIAGDIITELPRLQRGEAWLVPDPDWLGDEKGAAEPFKFRFRLRRTFDSSRPPKLGEKREQPKDLASVDLGKLREAMKADAPAEPADSKSMSASAARIAALEAEVAILQSRSAELPEWWPLGDGSEMRLRDLGPALLAARAIEERLRSELIEISELAAKMAEGALASSRITLGTLLRNEGAAPGEPAQGAIRDDRARSVPADARAADSPGHVAAASPSTFPRSYLSSPIGGGPQKMLEALAGYRDGRASRTQLGMLSGFAPSGGTFAKYLSTLKAGALVDVLGGDVVLTNAGRNAAGRAISPTSSEQLVAIWRSKLGGGPRKLLDVLIAAYPKPMSRATLGERSGFEPAGGTFAKYLSTLRSGDLVHVDSTGVRAADALFPTGPLKG